MVKKTLKTTIKWIDKNRKVNGVNVSFQKMYDREVAVFDQNDLRKLIRTIKKRKL